jgi:hypothetical protein
MSDRNSDFDRAKAEQARLTALGLLGFYTHVEATEIFAYNKSDRLPFNVFSILVAEEREGPVPAEPDYLGKRIELKSLKDWVFGIKRSVRPISEVQEAFERFGQTGEWRISDKRLHVGALVPAPMQFVPPDSTTYAPWNNVLKNNFWSGSYVIELVDPQKRVPPPVCTENLIRIDCVTESPKRQRR